MHLPHIRELPQVLPGLFADAAARALEAGFDGVELHYAHAYTMASFLSRTNTRDDGYGGSRENRVRLPLEVHRRGARARRRATTRSAAASSPTRCIEGGKRVDDAAYFGVEFARAGIDFLSTSQGGKFDDAKQPKVGEAAYPYTGPSGYECMPTSSPTSAGPFGRNVSLVAAIRAAVRGAGFTTPVVSAGGIHSFEQAEAILAAGDGDIVAAARQSLADPDWFAKIALGRGGERARLQVHQLLRGARPAAQAGHLQAVGSRRARRYAHETHQRWQTPRDGPGMGSSISLKNRRMRLVACSTTATTARHWRCPIFP